MRRPLPFFICFFFISANVIGQNCGDVFDISKDMDLSPHTITNKTVLYGKQTGMPSTFADVHYKFGCGSTPLSTTCDCNPTDLFYKVFYPTDVDYSNCALPVIIIFHGGGFADCSGVNDGSGSEQTGDDVITICEEFARKGFVAIDAEYRRGVYVDGTYVTAQQPLAIYRAQQDARGVIRCVIQRQKYQTAHTQTDEYKVDINNIFLGGNSAGSVTAMLCAYYYRQTKIDSILPGVRTALGSSIDANYYDPDVNNPNDSYNRVLDYRPYIKGVLNDWGNAFIHKAYAINPVSFMLNNDGYKPPIVSFHGNLDGTLPINQTPAIYAPMGATYMGIPGISIHSETHCLGACPSTGVTYTVNHQGNPNDPDFYSIGSQVIYDGFIDRHIATLLYIDCSMQHGLDDNDDYHSDFGTGVTDREGTYKYIAARAANFFQVVLYYNDTKNHYLNSTRFVDCEDYRHLGEVTDDDAGCHNADACDQ